MNIAISGKMCAGKSTLFETFKLHDDYKVISLAMPLKLLAKYDHNMPEGFKDRSLLINLGETGRSIHQDLWVNLMQTRATLMDGPFICDDVRYKNEVQALKDGGWTIIRLKIDPDIQLERIKKTYGDNWEDHWNNRFSPSETDLDDMPDEEFDHILENPTFETLAAFVKKFHQVEDASIPLQQK